MAAPVGAADEATNRASLAALAEQDLRVATISYRLLTAGAALCTDHAPQDGLLVHDLLQYAIALRMAATALFGFAGSPRLLAVVPGGPADQAGLRAGDAVVAVEGMAVPAPPASRPDRRRQSDAASAAVEAQLATALDHGSVELTIARDGAEHVVRIVPVAGCASTVQVEPGTKLDAWSDGHGVAVTSAIVSAAASDDELAAVIGHELAHNILHHRDRLDAAGVGRGLFSRVGSKAARVRETEREADYVGVYLAARAGYDPAAGAAFWARFGAAHGDGLFKDGTHPGWRERVDALTRAAEEIADKRARGAPLVPELVPPAG